MRIIAAYNKGAELCRISHLDVQRLLMRALRRAKLPLAFSKGFNPHPLLSFASALKLGFTSECEWFEVDLSAPVCAAEFSAKLNAACPRGFSVHSAVFDPLDPHSLASRTRAADYILSLRAEAPIGAKALQAGVEALLGGNIMVEKRTKSGIKAINIRDQILEVNSEFRIPNSEFPKAPKLFVRGKLQADGGLPVELLANALIEKMGIAAEAKIHRKTMWFDRDGALSPNPF